MRDNALKVRVFHELEINEQTTFVSAANGCNTLTRRSAKALTIGAVRDSQALHTVSVPMLPPGKANGYQRASP
jgi:hypothetical protein